MHGLQYTTVEWFVMVECKFWIYISRKETQNPLILGIGNFEDLNNWVKAIEFE